jgi:beta-lactamase regulating signal transducer with metallopeptidase domain
VHIGRRDYLLNLIYELLYIPLSFHPASGLIRRFIKQTRELCCDELVAQRIITPEAYARCLVKLAGSAPTLRRLSVTTTVGIADADILEARIMSLLKRPRIDPRWKTIALVVASLLLAVPCVAAATFAVRFEMQPSDDSLVQEPQYQERELKEKAQEKEKAKE